MWLKESEYFLQIMQIVDFKFTKDARVMNFDEWDWLY